MLGGCGRQQSDRLRILVSPKGLVHNFWLSVKAGADSAGSELGVDIIWKGPAMETDIPGQISILEDYINKRVDAIVIAATDSRALIPTLEEASRRGIKVITIDSGVESDIPLSFVASDNIKAANIAADVLVDLIGGSGQVACIPFIPGAETSIWRETGFKQGLEKYPDVDLVAVQYSQADVATAMAVTENILTAWPELDGIFAANESGAIGAAQALIARNMQGKVKLVVFDAAPNEIEALKSGVIQALIVQQPFEMGYLGVKTAVDAINGKPVEKRIDTGIKVVTMDNIDEPEIRKTLNPTGN
jgi:ribose transport system substrate-binding protein